MIKNIESPFVLDNGLIFRYKKTQSGYRFELVLNGNIVSSAYLLKEKINRCGNKVAELKRVHTKKIFRGKKYAQTLISLILNNIDDNLELHLNACPYEYESKKDFEKLRGKLFNLYGKFGFIRKIKTKSCMTRPSNKNESLF